LKEADQSRRGRALAIRLNAAKAALDLPGYVSHPVNSDESIPGVPGNFSKALPHDSEGMVDPVAYASLRSACLSGKETDFEAVSLGGAAKLADPQAGWAFSLEGGDPFDFSVGAAPSFRSAETAGEMVELYWHALLRDVPFADYTKDGSGGAGLAMDASADLSLLTNFHGPKQSSFVTPSTLFRSIVPGAVGGPYVSQFLYKSIPTGPVTYEQKYPVPAAGADFMVSDSEWLAVQNGAPRSGPSLGSAPRYLINARDLGEYMHRDFSYQAFLNAGLVLLGAKVNNAVATSAQLQLPAVPSVLNPANPYRRYTKQGGFATFGGPHLLDQVARVAVEALRAVWCQKWRFHRRLRPEEYGGRVHYTGPTNKHGLHADVLNSTALQRIRTKNGTAFLPMAYAEGCPVHPAYPSGHATIAGACVTILKAFFDGNAVIGNPVQPNTDGSAFEAVSGSLTVEGELNKLAANVAIGRNLAGVHWRTDAHEGMLLGEAVAIAYLKSSRFQWNETFAGATFRRFDGTTVTV
ncbi:MAG: vanadium-dependent haloperoxidase, partial [Opitutaceae bacterium]